MNNLVVIGGGRYRRIQTAQTVRQTGAHTARGDDATTVRAGVSYAIESGASPHFSCTESVQPPSADRVSTNVGEPTRGNQCKLGIKYQP